MIRTENEFIAFLYNIGKEVTRVLLRRLVESIVLTERALRLGSAIENFCLLTKHKFHRVSCSHHPLTLLLSVNSQKMIVHWITVLKSVYISHCSKTFSRRSSVLDLSNYHIDGT